MTEHTMMKVLKLRPILASQYFSVALISLITCVSCQNNVTITGHFPPPNLPEEIRKGDADVPDVLPISDPISTENVTDDQMTNITRENMIASSGKSERNEENFKTKHFAIPGTLQDMVIKQHKTPVPGNKKPDKMQQFWIAESVIVGLGCAALLAIVGLLVAAEINRRKMGKISTLSSVNTTGTETTSERS